MSGPNVADRRYPQPHPFEPLSPRTGALLLKMPFKLFLERF